jgi:transposase
VEIVHERCAALDVSKKDAKVCLRLPGKRRGTFTSEVTTWGATTNQVLALREVLVAAGVTVVIMESTGDYWKCFVRHEALVNRVGVEGPYRWSVAAGW